jgi:hypothetical protein
MRCDVIKVHAFAPNSSGQKLQVNNITTLFAYLSYEETKLGKQVCTIGFVFDVQ